MTQTLAEESFLLHRAVRSERRDQMFHFANFDAAPLRDEPCPFVVVPGFVLPEALAKINADYPAITKPGNFRPELLTYGPAFQALIDALTGSELRDHVALKFGLDLRSYATQMTIRRFAARYDGTIHNDKENKKIAILLYLNDSWEQEGGRLRLLRSVRKIDDFTVEVPPVGGTLLAFRRNEKSFHGFRPCSGERRSIQMFYVEPTPAASGAEIKPEGAWKHMLMRARFEARDLVRRRR